MGSAGEIVVSVGVGRDIFVCCLWSVVLCCGGYAWLVRGGLTSWRLCLIEVREHAVVSYSLSEFVAWKRLKLGLWLCLLCVAVYVYF